MVLHFLVAFVGEALAQDVTPELRDPSREASPFSARIGTIRLVLGCACQLRALLPRMCHLPDQILGVEPRIPRRVSEPVGETPIGRTQKKSAVEFVVCESLNKAGTQLQ